MDTSPMRYNNSGNNNINNNINNSPTSSPRRRAVSAALPLSSFSTSYSITSSPRALIPSPHAKPEEPIFFSSDDNTNDNRRNSNNNNHYNNTTTTNRKLSFSSSDEKKLKERRKSYFSSDEPIISSSSSHSFSSSHSSSSSVSHPSILHPSPSLHIPTNNNNNNQSKSPVLHQILESSNESIPSSPSRGGMGIGGNEKVKLRQTTFFEYIQDEIIGDYLPNQAEDSLKREEVYNFVHVPVELEKLLFFGFFICFDTFLFLFTFLPIRILIAFGKLVSSPFTKQKLNSAQICDLLRGIIWAICITVLSSLDPSIIRYHFIRGQATIKLYVIFNVLEIFDKLACSFGQDIFDSLYWMSVGVSKTGRKLPPITHFFVALIYVCLHSVVLFFQVVTMNVAINSHNNALLTLLISNQFVELKGSVFKKFEKENLFQISCSDMVERFQLSIFMTIIVLQNLKDLNWEISGHFLWQHLSVVLAVLLSECVVDAIKHAFITKFNSIKPEIYQRFTSILSRELLATKRGAFTESSWAISKRIGFVPLPLGCLFMRVFALVIPKPGLIDIPFVIIVLLIMFALKVLVRILLLGKSLQEFKNPEVIFNPPQLNHVSRFDMVKGKIP